MTLSVLFTFVAACSVVPANEPAHKNEEQPALFSSDAVGLARSSQRICDFANAIDARVQLLFEVNGLEELFSAQRDRLSEQVSACAELEGAPSYFDADGIDPGKAARKQAQRQADAALLAELEDTVAVPEPRATLHVIVSTFASAGWHGGRFRREVARLAEHGPLLMASWLPRPSKRWGGWKTEYYAANTFAMNAFDRTVMAVTPAKPSEDDGFVVFPALDLSSPEFWPPFSKGSTSMFTAFPAQRSPGQEPSFPDDPPARARGFRNDVDTHVQRLAELLTLVQPLALSEIEAALGAIELDLDAVPAYAAALRQARRHHFATMVDAGVARLDRRRPSDEDAWHDETVIGMSNGQVDAVQSTVPAEFQTVFRALRDRLQSAG